MEIINGYVCNVTGSNINIKDSYKVTSKSEMKEMLYAIQHNHPECTSFKRSYESLMAEWRAHNRLYRWGIKRDHTADVDLNYPLKWYVELIYRILGI